MRFKKRYSVLCLLAVAVLLLTRCTKEDNLQTRHFRMGFTPVPEELASNELRYAYSRLAAQADIVNYNLDGGVPWQESLDGKDYNSDILADWNLRR